MKILEDVHSPLGVVQKKDRKDLILEIQRQPLSKRFYVLEEIIKSMKKTRIYNWNMQPMIIMKII